MRIKAALPRSRACEQGISSEGITDFVKAIHNQQLELHSLMVLRHGQVVAEGWWAPYRAELPHVLFSLSKSFTSTAIGFAVAEGLLSLDDRIVSFFPEDAPEELSENLAAMEIRHLLMMGTGHATDTLEFTSKSEDGNWVKAFLDAPVEYAPGTHFTYNSGATYMLSAILQKASGLKLLDYLQPRLMEPLGIDGSTWESCPRGIHVGGWGLSVTTEDIAAFGQLYLQKGVWEGRRIIPEAWIETATSKHISNGDGGDNDWAQGYGYQFWRCRHGAYRGDGAFGQYCIVLPEQDAVIAITSGTNDMQAVLNAVWEHLLPAMQQESVALQDSNENEMTDTLRGLALHPPELQSNSPLEQTISGEEFRFDANDQGIEMLGVRFENDNALIVLQNKFGEHAVAAGRGQWTEGFSKFQDGNEHRIACSFGWEDPQTLAITVRMIETPFYQTLQCRFDEQEVSLAVKRNVWFGPVELSAVSGTSAD
jgi:CubicO group peptidase (beta-lactamase class C family)